MLIVIFPRGMLAFGVDGYKNNCRLLAYILHKMRDTRIPAEGIPLGKFRHIFTFLGVYSPPYDNMDLFTFMCVRGVASRCSRRELYEHHPDILRRAKVLHLQMFRPTLCNPTFPLANDIHAFLLL